MSSKPQVKLTNNGVLALYEECFKEVKVQVIFKFQMGQYYYVRLSDGFHLSPVVLMLHQIEVKDECFRVGAVISIQKRLIMQCEEDSDDEDSPKRGLVDSFMPCICLIKWSIVIPHTQVNSVLGALPQGTSYRKDMAYVLPTLEKWQSIDDVAKLEIQSEEHQVIVESQGESLRDQGNKFFNENCFEQALALYNVAKAKQPYDWRIWSNTSHAYFRMKDYFSAELHAAIAIKLNPFLEKAYYRASQAALMLGSQETGIQYAEVGLFLCGKNKDLQEILDNRTFQPLDLEDEESNYTDPVYGALLNSLMKNIDRRFPQKVGCYVHKSSSRFVKKNKINISAAFRKEPKREVKKKQPKKPTEGDGLVDGINVMMSAMMGEQKQPPSPPQEKQQPQPPPPPPSASTKDDHKRTTHTSESKNDDKNYKSKITLQEALQEGRRLIEADKFYQAIEIYNKCLTFSELTESKSKKGKSSEHYDVHVINFIIAMCKVQSSRGYVFEGLETMQYLCQDVARFPHKQAARYWVAVAFEKICCYDLAQEQANLFKKSLKDIKSVKPIKWPNTDEVIECTNPSILQEECSLLLCKQSSSRPSPKAKCRYRNCITTQNIPYAKKQIYLIDPEFKGYFNVMCEENCVVSYHPCCWKAFKEQHEESVSRMSDKDFLGQACVTPDCEGKIFSIQIFDDVGEMKNQLVKDKKKMEVAVKQKKKKDKKKEKVQIHKKRIRVESICEEQTNEETAVENSGLQGATANINNNNNSNNSSDNKPKESSHPIPALPIDPESLEKVQVTILKPGIELDPISPTKPKKKKKNKKITTSQPNLLGDPLEADVSVQSEYISRLRALRQQREALEAGESSSTMNFNNNLGFEVQPVMLLDPNNPFYLPQQLRDNPEELERVLQQRLNAITPQGLNQETINTLLDFMYDWLKSEGPMHTSDPRLVEQVVDNFPPEARDHVTQCGGVTGFLMQSIKFATIDGVICVWNDVLKAQEMIYREVTEKMKSKYLSLCSDGKKAKHFTHLIDDNKSTCSTASLASSSHHTSTSSKPNTYHSYHNNYDDDDDDDDDDEDEDDDEDTASSMSLAPLSKIIAKNFSKFTDCSLDPSAVPFDPRVSGERYSDNEDEEYKRAYCDDDAYIEKWAAQAGEEVSSMTGESAEEEEMEEFEINEAEEEENEEKHDEQETDEEEVEFMQEMKEEVEEEEGEEGELKKVEEDIEATEKYISTLQQEKEDLQQDLRNEQEQNQVLSDKLFQVKSQYKSEVMKLKQQLEELRDQNNELKTEKNTILLQKESEAKKYKGDVSRLVEDAKSNQSRAHSLQVKSDRLLDQKNEMEAKLAEEVEMVTQLKEEVDKMKDLQESLTTCSRRAREAEVKYLTTKKDLIDLELTRVIARLTEEAAAMRQLLPRASEGDILDRGRLTHFMVAWDDKIKYLTEAQRVFKEGCVHMLRMLHQGRPLNALSESDIVIPVIPNQSIAPLLALIQRRSPPSTLNFAEPPLDMMRRIIHPISKPPYGRDLSPHSSLMPVPPALMPKVPPMYVQNESPVGYSSGAIPKNGTSAPAQLTNKNQDITNTSQHQVEPNQLFVGQLPWEFTQDDVKNYFSRFGEVVSVTIYDKGFNENGKAVPKYGFITFLKHETCLKILSARPLYVGNHMLNIQEKEVKASAKTPTAPAAGGGGRAGGGGGLGSSINEQKVTNGLSDNTVEGNKAPAAQHYHHPYHHQPPPPPCTQSITKPKFQKLLPTNSSAGGIVAPPPKLIRPQGKTHPNASKLGQGSSVNEENAIPVSASYTRLIELCKQHISKEFTQTEIYTALQEVRSQNNNSLSGLTSDKIVKRVRQQLISRRPGLGAAKVAPWAGLTQGKGDREGVEWRGQKKMVIKDDTCSICLEPLITSPNQTLACQHTFHANCITDWIRIQSNCPNCRMFALMPDEYPKLA